MPKPKISMTCDIESRRATPERQAAWHEDCVIPAECECPAHANDKPGTANTVRPRGRREPATRNELRHLEVAEGRGHLPGRRL